MSRFSRAQFTASRRTFLGGAAAMLGTAGLWYPKAARAAAPSERKFLFFWAGGGWDTTAVLDPHFDTDGVDMEMDSVLGEAGNLRWTSGPARENVDRYFRTWGARAAIVNGVDAHTVGHDTGTQFMLTGTSASSYPDWGTLLAARSKIEYPLPHIVFSGPSFAGNEGQALVRAGGGTLLELIDGSINGRSDAPSPSPSPPVDDAIDEFVYGRVAEYAAQQRGRARERADGLLANIERAMELEGRQFEAGLNDLGNNILDQAIKASEMFRLGLSRCAMIRIPGGYDTHGDQLSQGVNQDAFYEALDGLFEHLATTPGHTSPWLIDEVVVVAGSEFGRTPRLNGGGGKDHWPYNSMLVAGAGVKGNQSVGYTDGGLIADPIDFATGMKSDSGDMLGCENVGTALLSLGGIDPNSHLPGVNPLSAIIRNG